MTSFFMLVIRKKINSQKHEYVLIKLNMLNICFLDNMDYAFLGETDWDWSSTDLNLVDAMLLNTSRLNLSYVQIHISVVVQD